MTTTQSAASLIRGNRSNSFQNIRGPGENDFLQRRRVRDGAIERRNPRYWRIELVEQILTDPRRDVSAEAGRHLIFVGDDDPIGLSRVRGNRLPVERYDCAQIYDRGA